MAYNISSNPNMKEKWRRTTSQVPWVTQRKGIESKVIDSFSLGTIRLIGTH